MVILELRSLPVFVPQGRKGHGAVPQTPREAQRFGHHASLHISPNTRSQGFPLENKPPSHISLPFSLSPPPCHRPDQRCSGDSQEVVRLVVQAVQFYEKKLRDFYTHLRYSHFHFTRTSFVSSISFLSTQTRSIVHIQMCNHTHLSKQY